MLKITMTTAPMTRKVPSQPRVVKASPHHKKANKTLKKGSLAVSSTETRVAGRRLSAPQKHKYGTQLHKNPVPSREAQATQLLGDRSGS